MIFNEDFLFIHVPKTAGMSLSKALLRSLKGQVFYAVQKGHAKQSYGETIVEGKRHQTLASADDYLDSMGLDCRLHTFKFIMAMVRNPYDMEISRYQYLRKGHEWDRGEAQDLALKGSFADFVARSTWWFDFADYYTVNGVIPDNLHIIKFEGFAETTQQVFGSCFRKKLKLKRLNKSRA